MLSTPTDTTRRVRTIAAGLAVLLAAAGGCKDRDALRQDENVEVVVAADRKLAKEQLDLLTRRGALRRQRLQLRDKRAALLTKKLALPADDEQGKQAIEQQEKEAERAEAQVAKQEQQLLKRWEQLFAKQNGLMARASKGQVKQVLLARREYGISLREKELARREQDLARREKTLAERERAFAARQARLCPGRVTTVVQTVAAPPRGGGSYKRKDVEPVFRAALKAMRRKGIRSDDLPRGVERLITVVRHAVSKGEYTKAKYAADQLLATVRKLRIDKRFIRNKIGVLSRKIAKRKLPPKIRQLFSRATADYGDGRFRAANRKLNRIYGLLH